MKNKEIYWEYLDLYSDVCIDIMNLDEDIDIPQCRKTVQETLRTKIKGADNALMSTWSCYESAFSNPKDKTRSRISVLDNQKNTLSDAAGISVIPGIVIGEYLVRGDSSPTSIISSICDSFSNPPLDYCDQGQSSPYPTTEGTVLLRKKPSSFLGLFYGFMTLTAGLACLLICAIALRKYLLRKGVELHGLDASIDRDVHSYTRMGLNKQPEARSRQRTEDNDL